MNESHQSRRTNDDRWGRVGPGQAEAASHEYGCRSDIATSFVKAPGSQVIPSHVLDDDEACCKDHK